MKKILKLLKLLIVNLNVRIHLDLLRDIFRLFALIIIQNEKT